MSHFRGELRLGRPFSEFRFQKSEVRMDENGVDKLFRVANKR